MPQPEQTDYTSLLRLDGRNAAVLGAGNGIGIESAHALAQAGAKVYCFDHHEDRAQEIASDVGGVGVSGDVTSREDLERLFTKMRDEDGGVDCLVDIVGRNTLGPLGALDDDDWADQLRMVVDHGFRAMQIGAREMAASGGAP
ncbi:MAG: SDR family oxidoreductase [Rhodospirillales bacterium]|jgi:NAD(P)-dependent dehydrogenase (short-subunit alcohol dehydrogenase family)|nr:SDR family oxidoreductase [Rhodospirillales bacterium]